MRAVEVQITDVAFGGKGVGRLNGKAAFVPYTIDDEKVRVQIVREHKKFAEGELERVVESSPHRVEPRCPYFGRCGGCVYQHIEYEHQLLLKWRQVKEILRRIAGVTDPPIRPFIASPVEYGYRNRITVHAQDGLIGLFRRESNRLVDIEHCPISAPEVNARLAELRATRPRAGHYTLRAEKGPAVFTQTNDDVALAMLDLIDRLLADAAGTLIDAYCGAGFFSKRFRSRFQNVIGVDWDRHAIAEAKKETQSHESYIAADVEVELRTLLQSDTTTARASTSAHAHPLNVIVDPPATGLSKALRAALLQCPPARLIYVSCNPATLARDLAELKDAFQVDSVTPLDMFPQTAEIEVVVDLRVMAEH